MDYLRTPDTCFENLPGYTWAPHYAQVDDGEGHEMRMHYLDEGERDAPVVLMLHGEPSWSYLYRHMIEPVVAAGYRVIAPDLIGFGRSDKPVNREDYTYNRHVGWVRSLLLDHLDLRDITLICQDWGGLIGLRLVGNHPERFARVIAANTFLPDGEHDPGEAFRKWRDFSQTVPEFPVSMIIQGATTTELPAAVLAAYDAPFPEERYKAGARQFPALVPDRPDAPGAAENREAWQSLMAFDKPFITAFSDKDPITAGADAVLRKLIPGCQGQPHTTIENGGHFLQEDQGEALARVLTDLARDA